MKKNSKIHLRLETETKNKLKQEALNEKKTFSEICRQKLRTDSQADRIERTINKIYTIMNKNKKDYK